MADRHARPVNALTAAAKILAPTRQDAPKPENWHDEAWGFRNTTGELSFAEMWLANSLSRGRLVAARRPHEPGAEPEPLEDGPAVELVASLAGGVGGQSALLRAFAAHLLTPGVGYLVGEPGLKGAQRWDVYSADQIRLSRRTAGAGGTSYEIVEGLGVDDVRVLPPGALPVKVWRRHPRYSWQPDSPVRGALPILRELSLLTQHVEATATSRLAGAGILAMDSNINFPGGWETWVEEFIDTINKPIRDRGLAAAYAPFPLRVPVPQGKAVKDLIHHLMFNTPFDEHALKLRDEAITRLATAMDMPRQALTGEQENHWGKWATTEEGITLHVEPNLELICDGITTGYLRPGLAAVEGRRRREVVTRQDEQRLRVVGSEPVLDDDDAEIIVWYDTSDLRARPDRSEDTKDAYDRWEATGDDLRREMGISEAEAFDPTDPAHQQRVWLKLIDNPTLAEVALRKLGMLNDGDMAALVQPPAPQPEEEVSPDDGDEGDDEPEGDEGDEGDRDLPDTDDEPAPSRTSRRRPPQPAAAHVTPAVALVAACDGLVYRALEKAGNRLRQAVRRRNGTPDCAAATMHTCLNAARERPLDQLLEGAWDRVPVVAGQLGEDTEALTAALDGYARTLIRTRQPHSWDRLAHALGCGPEVDCHEELTA